MSNIDTIDSDSLETQTVGLSTRVLRCLQIKSVDEIGLHSRIVRFVKRHGRIAELFRGFAAAKDCEICMSTIVLVMGFIILTSLIMILIISPEVNIPLMVFMIASTVLGLMGMMVVDETWESPEKILGGVGPGMIHDWRAASATVNHPVLGDSMLTWSPETAPDAVSNNDYEHMRKLLVRGIGQAWFYSHGDSINISDDELSDWLRGAVYDAWTDPDAWRDGRVTIHDDPKNTGSANNNVIKQCLVLITSIIARADALGLSVSDELTPIRETLREHANQDDEPSDKNAALSDDGTNMVRTVESLDHALSADMPNEHELENDVLPRLRRIDARLEAMGRDADTIHNTVMTLNELDTRIGQVAVVMSAR